MGARQAVPIDGQTDALGELSRRRLSSWHARSLCYPKFASLINETVSEGFKPGYEMTA